MKTRNFELRETRGRFFVRYIGKARVVPRGRRISAVDARYLRSCGKSFDAACVADFGVAVFAK